MKSNTQIEGYASRQIFNVDGIITFGGNCINMAENNV